MIDIIHSVSGTLIAIRMHGMLTRRDLSAAMDVLASRNADSHRIRVLVQVEDFLGLETALVLSRTGLETTRLDRIERMAIVGDGGWEQWASEEADLLLHAEVRYFDRAQVRDAWSWLGATPMPLMQPERPPLLDQVQDGA